MEESHVHDIARAIQLALAPAFLLTAIASLLNVFANRLARIVDRSRALKRGADPESERDGEAEVLQRRVHLVRWAISLGTMAALFVALVIATAFVGFLLQVNVSLPVAALFVAAMVSLVFGLCFFLWEVALAIGTFETVLLVVRRGDRARRSAPPAEGGH